MGIILSHPTGNANLRAAASGMKEAGQLLRFHTTIASFPMSILDTLGAFRPLSEIRRRRFDINIKNETFIWPWIELGRLIASKTGLSHLNQHEAGLFCIDAVYKNLDRHVASKLNRLQKKGATAVYSYEDGAKHTFLAAKELDLTCLYDLPIGYWRSARRLLEKEYEFNPEWASTMTGFQDSDTKLLRKDEELKLADRIFVASQFTAKTLEDYPGILAPIEVIPYGFPPIARNREHSPLIKCKPLRLLFVGGLSQRKGLSYLFEAVDVLATHVTLTIVGRKASDNCPALDAALAKHRWIPSLPNADVLKLMQSHDVLVFPSLFEGFGLVITEAMSQGTPVITTDRTAGPDFIDHGDNGWLVEAGSAHELQMAIERLLERPSDIIDAGKAAMETARCRPWEKYGNELVEAISKMKNK